MKVTLVKDTISHGDMNALADWLHTYPRLTKGPLTFEFEQAWSKFSEIPYSTFVNSGSSAVFLALYALMLANRMKNKKVIVPSLCWATDVAPLIQLGLEPVFCDSSKENLCVDLDQVEKLFGQYHPAALLLVHVLGFVPDMDRLLALCKQYNVELIEDCCEAMGSTYDLKQVGSMGTISCYSLYFGHTMSSIEGGLVCTHDKQLNDILHMIRNHGWARDLDEETQKKLKIENGVSDFKSIFTFYLPGFNMRPTDLQAFLALRQLERLPEFVNKREKNYYAIRKALSDDIWKPVATVANSYDTISNFAYPVIHPRWKEMTDDLIASGVETRPLIAGAISLQPFVKKYSKSVSYATWVENVVEKQGFYIPNHPELTDEEIQFMTSIINKYSKEG